MSTENTVRDAFYAWTEKDPVAAYRALQLRLMILQRGFTYDQVATETGVSRSYLLRALHGKTNAKEKFFNRVDDAVYRLTQAQEAAIYGT